jgi:hypothetical protein
VIVSHKYQFVIAAPPGVGAASWLARIKAEGEPGHLEIVGHANSVCVPEGCERYTRFFVDNPRNRLPFMWSAREGTPWEGPEDVQEDVADWLRWYCWTMRRYHLRVAMESGPNGWGVRSSDGPWMFFESPAILARTFAGIGNSPMGKEGPWGRAEIRIIYLEEPTRGWRDVLRRVVGTSVEAKQTRDLLNWHSPMSQLFYELPDELVATYLRDAAWVFTKQKGVENR